MTGFTLHSSRERRVGTRNHYSRWERLIRLGNQLDIRRGQLERQHPIVRRRSPALQRRIDQLSRARARCIIAQQELAQRELGLVSRS